MTDDKRYIRYKSSEGKEKGLIMSIRHGGDWTIKRNDGRQHI